MPIVFHLRPCYFCLSERKVEIFKSQGRSLYLEYQKKK